MRRHLIGVLVAVHSLASRAAIRLAGEHDQTCPTCHNEPCLVHCYECRADCERGDHEEWCETGAGMEWVTVRDLLHGGLRCGQCSCLLRWGDSYTSRPLLPADDPGMTFTFGVGPEVRLSVCLACAATP